MKHVHKMAGGFFEDRWNPGKSAIPQFWYPESLASACAAPTWADDVHQYCEMLRACSAKPYYQVAREGGTEAWRARSKVTHNLIGYISTIEEPAVRADTYTLLMKAGKAAVMYRCKYSKYPVTVTALAGEGLDVAPIDPFDGKPLRMREVDGGLVIYSVSDDGSDEGGDHLQSDTDWDGSDLTIFIGEAYRKRRERFEQAAAKKRKADGQGE